MLLITSSVQPRQLSTRLDLVAHNLLVGGGNLGKAGDDYISSGVTTVWEFFFRLWCRTYKGPVCLRGQMSSSCLSWNGSRLSSKFRWLGLEVASDDYCDYDLPPSRR